MLGFALVIGAVLLFLFGRYARARTAVAPL